jgi:hypothetical protein
MKRWGYILGLVATFILFVLGYLYQPTWESATAREIVKFAFGAAFGVTATATVAWWREFRGRPARRAMMRSLVLQIERSASGSTRVYHHGWATSDFLRRELSGQRAVFMMLIKSLARLHELLQTFSWDDDRQRIERIRQLSNEPLTREVAADPAELIRQYWMSGTSEVRAKALRRLVDAILPLLVAPDSGTRLAQQVSALEDYVFELEAVRERFLAAVILTSGEPDMSRAAAVGWLTTQLEAFGADYLLDAANVDETSRKRVGQLHGSLSILRRECECADVALELLEGLCKELSSEIIRAAGYEVQPLAADRY